MELYEFGSSSTSAGPANVDFEVRVMLIEGDYTNRNITYEPYQESKFFTLTATGNNCYTETYNNVIGGDNQAQIDKFGIEVKPNTTYTISMDKVGMASSTLYAYLSDDSYCDYNSSGGGVVSQTFATEGRVSYSITTGSTTKYMLLRLGVDTVGDSVTYSNIMVEEGSVATEYEPFIPIATNTYQNSYTYLNDKVSKITHNGFNYNFLYDNFGNTKQIKVENQALITNNYATNNGLLTDVIYGNNQTTSYLYDRFNRTIERMGTDGSHEYTYDARSNLGTYQDNVNNETTTYTYDLAERLIQASNTNGFKTQYTYDQNSNANSKKYILNTTANTTSYVFDNDNRITNTNLSNNKQIGYNYDTLSRLTSKDITVDLNTYTTEYICKDVENDKTTTILESIQNGANADDKITYTYDDIGNIETITKGIELQTKYYYDELNQLIREDDCITGNTITYEYDLGGNLLEKKEYTQNVGKLTGKVITENVNGIHHATIQAIRDNIVIEEVETEDDGTYIINLPIGTYDIKINKMSYLNYTIQDIPVTTDEITLLRNIKLAAGDVNGDGIINIFDIMSIPNYFYLTSQDPGYDIKYDLNEDGIINELDTDIVMNNVFINPVLTQQEQYVAIGKLTGKVITENINGIHRATVKVMENNTVIETVQTEDDGTYTFELPYGTYDVEINKLSYLSYTIQDVPITKTEVILLKTIKLAAGDVTGDGIINIFDVMSIPSYFYLTSQDPGYDIKYDLNEDGIINELDTDIAMNNAFINPVLTQQEQYVTIGKLTGKIITENINGIYRATVQAMQDDIVIETVQTEDDGTYIFELPLGTYDIKISKTSYLSYIIKDIPIQANITLPLNTISIDAGDVIEDETINIFDVMKIVNYLNLTSQDPNYDIKYDLNEDGIIDGIDVGIAQWNAFDNPRLKQEEQYVVQPNILDSIAPTLIDTKTYEYNNANWKDQLTNYNGQAINYDAIGNPISVGNDIGLTWQNGRQLATYADTGKNLSVSYKYNDGGIRTSKTVNNVETKYYLEGSKVIYEQTGNDLIYYSYDETGNVIGINYNDTQYWYIKNGQNDIIGILDDTLTQVVWYTYSTWGSIISIKDDQENEIINPTDIGLINQYLYRSYRYDSEIRTILPSV